MVNQINELKEQASITVAEYRAARKEFVESIYNLGKVLLLGTLVLGGVYSFRCFSESYLNKKEQEEYIKNQATQIVSNKFRGLEATLSE